MKGQLRRLSSKTSFKKGLESRLRKQGGRSGRVSRSHGRCRLRLKCRIGYVWDGGPVQTTERDPLKNIAPRGSFGGIEVSGVGEEGKKA